MKDWIIGLAVRMIDGDTIKRLIGKALAWVLRRARRTDQWATFYSVVVWLSGVTSCLARVWDDDTLTEAEEGEIADALAAGWDPGRVLDGIKEINGGKDTGRGDGSCGDGGDCEDCEDCEDGEDCKDCEDCKACGVAGVCGDCPEKARA